jgi:hypothetical protein
MDEVIRKSATLAYKKGWSLIPLARNSKIPNLPQGHPFLSRKPTREEYRAFDFYNYGIVCGPLSGICVLDVDGSEGEESLVYHGYSMSDYLPPAVRTPKGWHYYFKYTPDVQTGVGVFEGVDIRSKGSYVVGPGCTVSGSKYTPMDGFFEAELDEAPDFMRNHRDRQTIHDVSESWFVGEKIGDGQRNKTLTSLGGTLVVRGIPQVTVEKVLMVINNDMCDPTLEVNEIKNIARSVERYRNGG